MKCKCCNGTGRGRNHRREGARLKSLRKSKKISLRKFAGIIGVSPGMLSLIEAGKRAISEELSLRILNLF